MIVLHIAIHGDNEELAQKQLAELIERSDPMPHFDVYRAWTQRLVATSVDSALDDDVPHEVKL